jgi:hypothetical protein
MNLRWKHVRDGRFSLIIVVTLAGIVHLASRKSETHAQNQAPQHIRVSAIDDWSHHHMVYSRPSSIAQSLKLKLEPRYLNQSQKRNVTPQQRSQ